MPTAYPQRCRRGKAGRLVHQVIISERGNNPVSFPGAAFQAGCGIGASSVKGAGLGGAVVVLRGRESRPHGEGRQQVRVAEGRARPGGRR